MYLSIAVAGGCLLLAVLISLIMLRYGNYLENKTHNDITEYYTKHYRPKHGGLQQKTVKQICYELFQIADPNWLTKDDDRDVWWEACSTLIEYLLAIDEMSGDTRAHLVYGRINKWYLSQRRNQPFYQEALWLEFFYCDKKYVLYSDVSSSKNQEGSKHTFRICSLYRNFFSTFGVSAVYKDLSATTVIETHRKLLRSEDAK